MKLGLRTKLVGTLVGAIVISSAISAIAAAKSLSNALPGVTLSGLPVPSSLNWLMP